MASQSGSGGTDSDAVVDPSDPGARLLVRIGDFVEPLTRFDRSHLSMAESRHELVPVMARQVFRVAFSVRRSEGSGALPVGVDVVVDVGALAREVEGRVAAARVALPARLAVWGEEHGEDPLARPGVADCYAGAAPVGYAAACVVCAGAGKVACSVCRGEKEVMCEACSGRGASDCAKCGGRGQFACSECHGMGTTLVQKQRKVWDDAIDQERVEHFQETAPCKACSQTGKVACDKCVGVGQISCKTCGGRKVVTCHRCYGAGTEVCEACGGAGMKHSIASVECAVKETFEVSARGDPEIARVMKLRGGIEQLLEMSASHRATAEANKDTLTRDTMAMTPVTSVVISVGETRTMIHGFGAKQEVMDYRNLAGLLLEGDLAQLESAVATTNAFPPRVNDALNAGLSNVLASEANATIALGKAQAASEDAKLRGVLAGDYMKRAAAAMRTAVTRAYWAGLARWPAAVLAAPLLVLPLDLVVRSAGARLAVLLAIVLVTFGGAVAAHFFVVHELQKQVRPDGAPKLAPIIAGQGLTQTWFIAAGGVSVILTLLLAGLASAVFPAA